MIVLAQARAKQPFRERCYEVGQYAQQQRMLGVYELTKLIHNPHRLCTDYVGTFPHGYYLELVELTLGWGS